MNGLQINLDVYDVFSLVDAMKSEAKILEGLHSLGFKVCFQLLASGVCVCVCVCVRERERETDIQTER